MLIMFEYSPISKVLSHYSLLFRRTKINDMISLNGMKATSNPMQLTDGTIFGKTSDNVGDSDVIGINTFVALTKNDRRIIRSAGNDIDCDYVPETVVLNHDSIVDYRYAMYHHDDEDVLTDKQYFENYADSAKQ